MCQLGNRLFIDCRSLTQNDAWGFVSLCHGGRNGRSSILVGATQGIASLLRRPVVSGSEFGVWSDVPSNRPVSGQRIRHQNVVEDKGPIENSEIVKGYEYSKGKYIVVEPDEISNLRIETKKIIDVQQFVDVKDFLPQFLRSRTL